jgi:predicted negative regulator of RcsB-dependent stress response
MARRTHDSSAGHALDELQSEADRLGQFLERNARTLAIAIVALLLVAAAVSWLLTLRRGAETDAALELATARADYLQAMGAPPGSLVVPELANPEAAKRIREESVARYAKVADEHSGSVSGALARLEAAELQMESGEVEPALATLRQALDEAPSRDGLRGMLLQREAQALEQAGRPADAAELHEQASGLDGYPLRFFALADAARCRALAGDVDAARALYTRLDAEAPELRLPEYQRIQKRELVGPPPAPAAGETTPSSAEPG